MKTPSTIVDAKEAELENCSTKKVYEEVRDEGQKTIGVSWVITNHEEDKEHQKCV